MAYGSAARPGRWGLRLAWRRREGTKDHRGDGQRVDGPAVRRLAVVGDQETPEQLGLFGVDGDRFVTSPATGGELDEQRPVAGLVDEAEVPAAHDEGLDRHPPDRLEPGVVAEDQLP